MCFFNHQVHILNLTFSSYEIYTILHSPSVAVIFDASGGHYTVICNFLETVDLLMRRQYKSIECFSMWAHETYDIGRVFGVSQKGKKHVYMANVIVFKANCINSFPGSSCTTIQAKKEHGNSFISREAIIAQPPDNRISLHQHSNLVLRGIKSLQ